MSLLEARRRRFPVRRRSDIQDQGRLQLIEGVANPLQRGAHGLNAIHAAAERNLVDAEAPQPERALPVRITLRPARRAQRNGELAPAPVARNENALPEDGAEWLVLLHARPLRCVDKSASVLTG